VGQQTVVAIAHLERVITKIIQAIGALEKTFLLQGEMVGISICAHFFLCETPQIAEGNAILPIDRNARRVYVWNPRRLLGLRIRVACRMLNEETGGVGDIGVEDFAGEALGHSATESANAWIIHTIPKDPDLHHGA
jgi:hypothetical protein